MKVIFLDIDGVLNTAQTFDEIDKEYESTGTWRIEIDLNRVQYLKRIVDATGAVIVLSSSWKDYFLKEHNFLVPRNKKALKLVEILNQNGLFIYDITPKDPNGIRENEIMMWIDQNKVETFLVIDDDSSDLQMFVGKNMIKTSFTKDDEMVTNMDDCFGLCEHHIDQAIDLLNGPAKILKKN